jgi:hypothetical protein
MESHFSKQFLLSELSPSWSEDLTANMRKTSIRQQGSFQMSLLKVGKTPENSRKYLPGDPVGLIDWKAFARTDDLIVREHRDEASAKVMICIDLGLTMRWPDDSIPVTVRSTSKAEVAIRVGLWMAYSHLVSGDAVEIWIRDKGNDPSKCWIPRNPSDVLSVFESCKESLSQRITDFFRENLWNSLPKRDLAWILSDCLDDWVKDDFLQGLKSVHLIHVLSNLERNIAWMDDNTSYVAKTPARKEYMGSQLKSGNEYSLALNDWRQKIETSFRTLNGGYFLAFDDTPVGNLIHYLLSARGRR